MTRSQAIALAKKLVKERLAITKAPKVYVYFDESDIDYTKKGLGILFSAKENLPKFSD